MPIGQCRGAGGAVDLAPFVRDGLRRQLLDVVGAGRSVAIRLPVAVVETAALTGARDGVGVITGAVEGHGVGVALTNAGGDGIAGRAGEGSSR